MKIKKWFKDNPFMIPQIILILLAVCALIIFSTNEKSLNKTEPVEYEQQK